MEYGFDEFSKALAGATSRREALQRAGGLLAGALLASLGLDREAWAKGECRRLCTSLMPEARWMAARLECIRDCDACRAVCPSLSPDCLMKCADECRVQCLRLGYPQNSRQLHWCVTVCGQCWSRGGGLCYNDTPRGREAVCCCEPGYSYCPDTLNLSGSYDCCTNHVPEEANVKCCPDGKCHSANGQGEYGNPPLTCYTKPDGTGSFVCGHEYKPCYPTLIPYGWVCCHRTLGHCCAKGCQGIPCS